MHLVMERKDYFLFFRLLSNCEVHYSNIVTLSKKQGVWEKQVNSTDILKNLCGYLWLGLTQMLRGFKDYHGNP